MFHDNTNSKTCTKCGNTYPATTEHFNVNKHRKDGFNSWCKSCMREYRQINRDRIRKQKLGYNRKNKDRVNKYQHEYRQANQEKVREREREYRQTNIDKMREKTRKYQRSNRVKIREQNRKYQKENSDKYRIATQRRKARKRNLPDTFTHEQWIGCLEYFDYSCAVCRVEFGDTTPHADHWIPLSNPECPGTVAENMVCLCNNCNWSKKDVIPNVWLAKRYEVDKVIEILARIENYFNNLE